MHDFEYKITANLYIRVIRVFLVKINTFYEVFDGKILYEI